MTNMKITYLGDLKTESVHEESGAKIITAAPKDVSAQGGTAFSPTDLLALSLGSCMLTLMGMAAKKLSFDFKECTIEVEKEMSASPPRRISRLILQIRSTQSPPLEIRSKLEKAALECPVAHSLHPEVKKEIQFFWGL